MGDGRGPQIDKYIKMLIMKSHMIHILTLYSLQHVFISYYSLQHDEAIAYYCSISVEHLNPWTSFYILLKPICFM